MGTQKLVERLEGLRKSEVGQIVRARMEEFRNLGKMGNPDWFSEMCFCTLTANSKAKLGIKIQQELGPKGFQSLPGVELRKKLKEAGHRHPNKRSQYIVEAREYRKIKDIVRKIGDSQLAREWLVKNVKGLGYKEASHFLRNVGFDDLAILDRHVLRVIQECGIIDVIPKTLTKKRYFEIEDKLRKFAQQMHLPLGELDLYLWYIKTKEVLK